MTDAPPSNATTTDRPEMTCPLCGGENHCAMAAGQPPENCWCWDASLDPEALAAIPPEAQGKYCICARCGGVTEATGHDR